MVEAHSGSIGGEESNEFMVLAETGEDKILLCECGFAANAEMKIEKCPKCGKQMMTKNAIEIAHIFKLNDLYSKKMNVKFVDKDGKQKFYQMGCYGIGVDRLLATIVEVHHDERGIIWPRAIAPYDAQLLEIQNPAKQDLASRDKSQNPKSRIQNTASDIYQELTKAGVSVLYDDRENVSAGEKFADADLLGMSIRIVVSEKSLEKGGAEVKKRGATESEIVALGDLAGKLKN